MVRIFQGGCRSGRSSIVSPVEGTMKYLLLIHDEEAKWDSIPDQERGRIMGEYGQLVQQLKDAGQYVTGSQLQPTSTATSVRVRDGKRLVTDGPFAETREQLGGYFLVDVANLDEAIAIAGRIPSARFGTIEVRPLVEMPVAAAR
jgi:hypothetical protein